MAYDEQLAERVRAAIDGEPVDAAAVGGEGALAERRMFGGLAFLVGGNMALAVSGQGGLMVRVPERSSEVLLTEDGVEPMVMQGREMRGWLRVADTALGDDDVLETWVRRGVDYARTLPAK